MNKNRTNKPAAENNSARHLSKTSLCKIAIILQLFSLTLHFNPFPVNNGDNAKYFSLGSAISEMKGYRMLWRFDEPVESKYPVLFPALLAGIQKLDSSIVLSKIFVSILSLVTTLVLCALFKKINTSVLFITLLCITVSSVTAHYSVILMSEIPYLFFTVLAFYYYDKMRRNPDNKLLLWLSVIFAVLPAHCRSIGIMSAAALLISALVFDRQYRFAAAGIPLLVLSILIYKLGTEGGNSYFIHLLYKNTYNPDMGFITLSDLFIRIVNNLKTYSGEITGQIIIPLLTGAPDALRYVVSSFITAAIIAGWTRLFTTGYKFLGLYLSLYTGVLLVWQEQWSGVRFLTGIIPFLFLCFFLGIITIYELISDKDRLNIKTYFSKNRNLPAVSGLLKTTLYISAGIILFTNLISSVNHRINGFESQSPDWQNFYHCADWLRENSDPDSTVVVSRKPELVYLRSKRKGFVYPFTYNTEAVLDSLIKNKATHIICDNFMWTHTTRKYLYPLLLDHSELFTVVYAQRNPYTYVLRFNPE